MKEIKRFNVKLITKDPFRIGSLQDVMSAVDNPVATVGGKAVIQGSSLKGALRASIEEYLIVTYPKDPYMKPCIPSPENTLSPDERRLIESGKYKKGGGCHYSTKSKSDFICPACYLLGANGLMGFVRVPYLYTEREREELYSVRIDRATGVVSERTNRDYEIIADGTVFEGILEVFTKDPRREWELGKPRKLGEGSDYFQGDKWLESTGWNSERVINELIVERLQAIDTLGGFKSKGCGKVEINITEIKP